MNSPVAKADLATREQRKRAEERITLLSSQELEGLKNLLVDRKLTGDQIRDWYKGIDFTEINRKTTFLIQDLPTDRWSVDPEWQPVLNHLLFPSLAFLESDEMPITLERLCNTSRTFRFGIVGFWDGIKASRRRPPTKK